MQIILYIGINITITFFAVILDLIIGDPSGLPHLVIYMGRCISAFEAFSRRYVDKKFYKLAGFGIVIMSLSVCALAVYAILKLIYLIPVKFIGYILQIVLVSHMLAAKSLKTESMKVYNKLKEDDIAASRKELSMIVGRDTENLSKGGVIKAAVETVAENFSDGVFAPILYSICFGIWGIYLYKMINTMDSMIGYKDEKYKDIGMAAAKLDDIVNYIPARLSAYLLILASAFKGLNYKNAYKIYRRDRYKHSSPNSAHTEAVVAGAFGVKLAGDAYYFGKLVKKDSIGDELREVDTEDIALVNSLMYMAVYILMGILLIIIVAIAASFMV